MTRREVVDGVNHIYLEVTPDEKCEMCGTSAECRPYGPNGSNVCFDCGMKNESETRRNMERVLGIATTH